MWFRSFLLSAGSKRIRQTDLWMFLCFVFHCFFRFLFFLIFPVIHSSFPRNLSDLTVVFPSLHTVPEAPVCM
jgi:hypothetical protein